MAEDHIAEILKRLGSREARDAWSGFIEKYGALIFQVVRHFEADKDHASDCFQFVCERLCEARFRRLRRFKPIGPAKFSTWLRAVVRNLCLDWRRQQFGRRRLFSSISRLSEFDQEIFRLVHEGRATEEEALALLRPKFPNVTSTMVSQAVERINQALTGTQNWLLQARSLLGAKQSADASPEKQDKFIDSAPDPEALAIRAERTRALNHALRGLSNAERLLIKLRFDQELTLDQIAKLLELGNAQRVDRQIKQILLTLRIKLG
jgi:RNA polymerase sigma factor (sigma-70 family)